MKQTGQFSVIIGRFMEVPLVGACTMEPLGFIAGYGGAEQCWHALRRLLVLIKNFGILIRELTTAAKTVPYFFIFSLALASTAAAAQTAFDQPRTIRVVMDNAYAP